MQVTFVKPTLGYLDDGGRFVDEARMEPLSLAVLAGLTPAGVDVRLFDDRIDEIDYDEPTDLVAISVETFMARRAYEIADEYREAARARGHGWDACHAAARRGRRTRGCRLRRRRRNTLVPSRRRCT